jgi:hypothetical protein
MLYPGQNWRFHFGIDIIRQLVKGFAIHASHKIPEINLPDVCGKLYLVLATMAPRVVLFEPTALPAKPIAVCCINPEAGTPLAVFRTNGAGKAGRFKVALVNLGRLLGYPGFCLCKSGVTVAIMP